MPGLGAFPADVLTPKGTGSAGTGSVLNAVASPGLAERLGRAPRRITSLAGDITVRIAAVRSRTPAAPGADFLLVDAAGLEHSDPTTLPATGAALVALPEVPRRTEVDAEGQESLVAREFATLDRAGRLQLPAEYTAALGMEDRVMLELERDHIGVWPDDTGRPAG